MELDEYEHTRFTPWIEMLMDDLTTLSDNLKIDNLIEKRIQEEIRIEGHHPNGEFIWQLHEVLKWDEDKLRMYEHPAKRKRDDNKRDEIQTAQEHECDICKYKGSKQQVAMHMSKTHNKRRKLINYVPGNFCPLCQTVFSNQKTAVQHLERLEVRYGKDNSQTVCKTKNMNKGAPYKKNNLASYECNECNKTFKLDEIDKHIKAHIEHLIFQKTMNLQGGRPMGVLGMLMNQRDDSQ
jgi:hypothetical protein